MNLEKSVEKGNEANNDTSSSSSSNRDINTDRHGLPLSPTSYKFALQNKSYRSDIILSNVKNVVNFPTNSDDTNQGNSKPHCKRRSLSSIDFHEVDLVLPSELYVSDSDNERL